jgi:hypothetical protein
MSQKLWQAVLLTTIEDALLGPSQVDNRDTRIHLCKEARRYLTSPNPDLAEVCALADMDMETVIERMRLKIAQAPTAQELADSPRQSAASFSKKAPKPKAKRIPLKDRPYTIGGETRTIAEWCDRSGISIALAQARLNQSWPPERALTATKEQARQEQRAEARRSFQTSFAEHSAKIKEGLRRSEALYGKPKRGNAPVLYEHEGQWRSLKEWSELIGIGKNTLYARITRQGMTFAQAVETPVEKLNSDNSSYLLARNG